MIQTLPKIQIERGAYSVAAKTGTMAAGLAAASPVLSFRWAPSVTGVKALIDRIAFSLASLGTGFAAGVGLVEAVAARSFTVPDYGGVAAPAATSAVAAEEGGTLAADTYYYVITGIGPWGETVASSELNATITGSTGAITITYGTSPGATGYRIYRGTATGVYDVYFADAASTFVDTGAAGTAGAPGTTTVAGGVTLSTNNAKRQTSMESTLASLRCSSTQTLVAGTRTLDANPFAAVQFAVSTAQNTVHLPTTDVWTPSSGKDPILLVANEGFILRATVPATGTWQGIATVEWREVT